MTSKQKRKLTEFLFLLPTLIAFFMVIIIPFILGVYYSFTDWQGTGAASQMVGFVSFILAAAIIIWQLRKGPKPENLYVNKLKDNNSIES